MGFFQILHSVNDKNLLMAYHDEYLKNIESMMRFMIQIIWRRCISICFVMGVFSMWLRICFVIERYDYLSDAGDRGSLGFEIG